MNRNEDYYNLGMDGTEYYPKYHVTNGELRFTNDVMNNIIDVLETAKATLVNALNEKFRNTSILNINSNDFETWFYFQKQIDFIDEEIRKAKEDRDTNYRKGYSTFMVEHGLDRR